MKNSKKIKEIVNILKKYKPEKIILFGSWAYGKPNKDSDIDLCLLKRLKRPAFIEKRFLWQLFWDAGFDFEPEPDLRLYDTRAFHQRLNNGDPFLEEINKGKILYEKRRTS